jgi:hypothetical protein
MVHRCDSGVVNQDIEAPLVLPNLREHTFDGRFISDIQAIVSIVRKFSFKGRTATSNYLALFAGVMLDQGAANTFTRPRN